MTVVLIDEGPKSAESEIVLEYVRDQFAGMHGGKMSRRTSLWSCIVSKISIVTRFILFFKLCV